MKTDKSDKPGVEALEEEAKARRDFLKKAGTVGLAAPAVAVLLSTDVKAQAQGGYGPATRPPQPTSTVF